MLCRVSFPGGEIVTLTVEDRDTVSEVIAALLAKLKKSPGTLAACGLSLDNIVALPRNAAISSFGTSEVKFYFLDASAEGEPSKKAEVQSDAKAIPVQDQLKLAPSLKKIIGKKEKGEFLIFSDKVKKINNQGKQQNRVVLLTNLALYNLKSRIGMDYVCKRRVEMEELTGLVVSLKSPEFVVQVHGHYDYHYTSKRNLEIADVIAKIYAAAVSGSLTLKYLEVADLSVYVGSGDTQSSEMLKSGWLEKEGGAVQNWKMRWFVLYNDRVMYFKDQQSVQPLKTILLTRTTSCQSYDGKTADGGWHPAADASTWPTYFSVVGKQGGRPFRLKARDEGAAGEWVTAINHQANQLAAVRVPLEGFAQEVRALVALKISPFAIELYILFTHMVLVAPQSVGCAGLLTLIKALHNEREEMVLSDVLNLLRSSFASSQECLCATDDGNNTSRASNNGNNTSDNNGSVCGILVRKAFEFCGGDTAIVRYWESLVYPNGPSEVQRTVFLLLRTLALTSLAPRVECRERLHLEFVSISVEEGRVYSEKNKLDYALYDVRISLGEKEWYIDKTFPELRSFMKSLEEDVKGRGLVIPNVKLVLPLLDVNTLSGTSAKALKSRANMFTDYFLALSAQDNWNDIVHLPLFQDFFDFRNVVRPLSCLSLRRAVETASNALLPDTRLMDMLSECLFEAMLLAPDSKDQDSSASPSRSRASLKSDVGFNLKSAINGPFLPIYLTSLAASSPAIAGEGLGNINILLSTASNVFRLSEIPWKHTLLPFLNGRQPVRDTRSGLEAIRGSLGVSVEITIKCRNLIRDVLTKSDPVVEMYSTDRRGKNVYVGQTEILTDDHNPNFAKRFYIPYNPSQVPRQNLTFMLHNAEHSDLRRVDRMGYVSVALHDLLSQQVSEHAMVLLDESFKRTKDKKTLLELGSSKVEPRFIIIANIPPYPEKTNLSQYGEDVNTMETDPARLKEVRAACLKLDSGPAAVMLDDQEVVLAYSPLIQHFGGKEEEMKNLLKHCVVLTSRRVSIIHEGTNLTIWRNHISYVETFNPIKGLVVWLCHGEIIKAAPFNVNVMRFLHHVLSDDARFAPPEQQSVSFPRQAATQEHKMALMCLVQELLHRFRRPSSASSPDSFQSTVLGSIENLCQNTHWSRSQSLPCARAVLSALLSLIVMESTSWKHQYTHPCWRNLTQLCTAFHRFLLFEPSNTSQYARRKAGLNIVNIDLAEKISRFFDTLKVDQIQPELVTDEIERKQCAKLKRAVQPWVAIWTRVVNVLRAGDGALQELRDVISAQIGASSAKLDHRTSGISGDLALDDRSETRSKSRSSLSVNDLDPDIPNHDHSNSELTGTQILAAIEEDQAGGSPGYTPAKPAKPKKMQRGLSLRTTNGDDFLSSPLLSPCSSPATTFSPTSNQTPSIFIVNQSLNSDNNGSFPNDRAANNSSNSLLKPVLDSDTILGIMATSSDLASGLDEAISSTVKMTLQSPTAVHVPVLFQGADSTGNARDAPEES